MSKKPLKITDVTLRDAHQSLLATRLRMEDMLPIASQLDKVGFHSLETWGGATFDACIRYLGEDPWQRLQRLKEVMPNTPLQMLFRGQNILGYRHYADDVVKRFVARAAHTGIDIFRIFDAFNDVRNLKTAIAAVKAEGKHAQGTLSYTTSPVHNLNTWLTLAKQLEDLGADSLCIKDMAGLLKPYYGFELVRALKKTVSLPIYLHCHATTGFSTATILKCVEADIDGVDTAISSMSLTYGHSPTETVVAIFKDSERDTGLDWALLEEIGDYFIPVRKKYAKFEGELKGVDTKILAAQVPGGMLTNMENQLREQGVTNKMPEVMQAIPKVRKDLGYIPLVTPTSQIVGTQAVFNVLTQKPYERMTKEVEAILKGEYGKTPAAVDKKLQRRVLQGKPPITCRPADLIDNELDTLKQTLLKEAKQHNITLNSGARLDDDILIYALFPQIGLKFLQNRGNASAFEEPPSGQPNNYAAGDTYTITLEGKQYVVRVDGGGTIDSVAHVQEVQHEPATRATDVTAVPAPLAGIIQKILVKEGDKVATDTPIMVMESMKMETTIQSIASGIVAHIAVKVGDQVKAGQTLLQLT